MQISSAVRGFMAALLGLTLLAALGCGVQATPASVAPANPGADAPGVAGDPGATDAASTSREVRSDSVLTSPRPAAATKSDDANPTGKADPSDMDDTDGRSDPEVDEGKHGVIEVSGVGVATGVPDLASLSLGVSVTAESVSVARNETAETVQAVMDALVGQSIRTEDISTVRFTIHPEYDYVQGEERFKGYRVFNMMQVIVRDIEAVGPTIDASIDAGGNNIVFRGLNFSFSDTKALQRQARAVAIRDMAVKAAQMAEFTGRELGDLKKVAETTGTQSPFLVKEFGLDSAAAAAFDTGIQPGRDEIRVFVYGVYELR